MKKTLAAVGMAAAMLLAPTVVPAAVATSASAAIIEYKCQRYDWFFGWRIRYTTNVDEAIHMMRNGWACVCIYR
jgi:hypothetical protein